MALKAAYGKVLQEESVDESQIACYMLQNRVFEFCSYLLQTDDMTHLSPLMKNPYPLDPPNALAGLVAQDIVCVRESDK